jgi:hypothetical protein
MARPFAVEKIETGDRAVLWFQGAPAPVTVIVDQIEEGKVSRTLKCSHEGVPFELIVPHGHTVDLVC